MAMDVLLQAVNERAQLILNWDSTRTIIGLDGMPASFAGQFFLAVHPGAISNQSQNYLDESHDVSLTLTMRSDYAPSDRVGPEILVKQTIGLYALLRQLKAGLHMDYHTLDFCGGTYETSSGAGVWIGGKPYSLSSAVNGFQTPLHYVRTGLPQPKGPDWFWSIDDDSDSDAATGVAVQMDFAGARRIQSIESMT